MVLSWNLLEECLDTFSTGVSVILNVLGRAQTPVCKKSKDKRARSHPGCCGGKQAWYCLGICCKGGGALSCCGANFGWTLHPVVDRYCYADEGSYPYVDGTRGRGMCCGRWILLDREVQVFGTYLGTSCQLCSPGVDFWGVRCIGNSREDRTRDWYGGSHQGRREIRRSQGHDESMEAGRG